jgi:anthranilate synthase component I
VVNQDFIKRRLSPLPALLSVHGHWPDRWPFLLASSASAGSLGRWSMLLRSEEEQLVLWPGKGGLEGPGEGDSFLARLRSWTSSCRSGSDDDLPLVGGWFVYLGYELIGEIEPRLRLPPAKDGLPMAMARRCRAAILQDHREGECWLVAEDAESFELAMAEIESVPAIMPSPPVPPLRMTVDPGQQFTDGVDRIRRWILDGDVFQVNLSRAWHAESEEVISPVGVYAALAEANPAPFAALARLPGGTVISSSPERLVELRGGASRPGRLPAHGRAESPWIWMSPCRRAGIASQGAGRTHHADRP